jgi:hypothetical protein
MREGMPLRKPYAIPVASTSSVAVPKALALTHTDTKGRLPLTTHLLSSA